MRVGSLAFFHVSGGGFMSSEYRFRVPRALAALAALAAVTVAAGVHAQAAPSQVAQRLAAAGAPDQLREVIVTAARKRAESIINVPVDEQAISGSRLDWHAGLDSRCGYLLG